MGAWSEKGGWRRAACPTCPTCPTAHAHARPPTSSHPSLLSERRADGPDGPGKAFALGDALAAGPARAGLDETLRALFEAADPAVALLRPPQGAG